MRRAIALVAGTAAALLCGTAGTAVASPAAPTGTILGSGAAGALGTRALIAKAAHVKLRRDLAALAIFRLLNPEVWVAPQTSPSMHVG